MKELITKNIIYYFIALVVVTGFGSFKFLIPKLKTLIRNTAEIHSLNSQVSELKAKTAASQVNANIDDLPVTIYKSPYQNLSLENTSVDLVNDLINKVKESGNKVLEISFETSDQGNIPNVKDAPKVLTVKLTLNSNYLSLKKFFSLINAWEYLSGLKYLSLTRSQENPNILQAKLEINLYIN